MAFARLELGPEEVFIKSMRHTGFADGLFTAGQAEGVDGQLAAIGASQFVWDIVGGQRA